jgi:5'-nucleotidase
MSVRLPRILLTNDDGIDAPGFAILEQAAAAFADEVWVVAPAMEQSAKSQTYSYATPVRYEKRGDRRFAVHGTPVDCVLMALGLFMKDNKPSILLSGVNEGTNQGDAVAPSGTVGAALTGLQFGIPSIALSQCYTHHGDVPWETTKAILPMCLDYFLTEGWNKETCLSVNIPGKSPEEISGIEWARQTPKTFKRYDITPFQSPQGRDYAWIAHVSYPFEESGNTESAALGRGKVSVVALTNDRSVEVLKPTHPFQRNRALPTSSAPTKGLT